MRFLGDWLTADCDRLTATLALLAFCVVKQRSHLRSRHGGLDTVGFQGCESFYDNTIDPLRLYTCIYSSSTNRNDLYSQNVFAAASRR